MKAYVRAMECHLPARILANEQLAAEFPEWTAERIEKKLGVVNRHVAEEGECASDLAAEAARKLFAGGGCGPEDVDYLLLCTQSPDHFLPTTACLLQHRLGMGKAAGALDFNLGCSGFVDGLGLAKGLVETGQARNVLLLTAETYSKHLHPQDKGVRTLFGDGAAATLVSGRTDGRPGAIGPFVYGTDGSGGGALIVPSGGMRDRGNGEAVGEGRAFPNRYLFMDGGAIFNFTLKVVPESLNELLSKAGIEKGDVDLFVFHQANAYMLEFLQKKCGIPGEKFMVSMRETGNTVSSTIPIALKQAAAEGRIGPGSRIAAVGFGVGLSWAAGLLEWG